MLARRCDTEGADEGESHDQAEQGLRDPFHRIQHVHRKEYLKPLTFESNAHWLNLRGRFADYLQPAEQTLLHKVGAEHSIGYRSTIEPPDFIFDAIGPQ